MLVWDIKYFLSAASSTSADNCPASPAQFTATALGKASLLCSRLATTQNKTHSSAEALP